MFQKPKGTRDIFGKRSKYFLDLKNTFFNISKQYNFSYIETPMFESYDLFVRSSGETSDIVNKEMYVFEDRSNRKLALRPEGTAPTIRAIVENKLFVNEDKFFYFGPMFRYERPQKGRYRQFYQAGIEFLGEQKIYNDFEVISFANKLLKDLKINDFVLKINCLGTKGDRENYLVFLREYLRPFLSELSEESKIRFEKNPMRILDDKNDSEKPFVKNAPKIMDYISQEAKEHFEELLEILKSNNIEFEIDDTLVRGLDYYDGIVFEFVSNSEALGTKSTIIGGGRYNSMIKEFGGPDSSSMGFGVGVERLLDILEFNDSKEEKLKDIFVGTLNEEEFKENIVLVNELRKQNLVVEWNKEIIKIQKLFKKANEFNFLIFKEKDQEKNYWTIKNSKTKENKILSLEDIKNIKEKLNDEQKNK